MQELVVGADDALGGVLLKGIDGSLRDILGLADADRIQDPATLTVAIAVEVGLR